MYKQLQAFQKNEKKIALAHFYWCLNRNQVWVKQHLLEADEQRRLTQDNSVSSIWNLNDTRTYVNLTLFTPLSLSSYCTFVLMAKSKEKCFQIRFDPGLTGTTRFPRVLDFRDLCLYHEPRMSCVVTNCCSLLLSIFCFLNVFFCWLSLTPSEDQRHGAFECCPSCSKVNRPSVH